MREATIQELVKDLHGKTVKVESVDIYGVNVSFFMARVECNEEDNESSFVSGRHDSEWGFGGISYRVMTLWKVSRLMTTAIRLNLISIWRIF